MMRVLSTRDIWETLVFFRTVIFFLILYSLTLQMYVCFIDTRKICRNTDLI
jgi:hypothetical protein